MIARYVGQWMVRERTKRAIIPEADAINGAQGKGFNVVGARMRRDVRVKVNDSVSRFEVEGQLRLEKWGRRYIGVLGMDEFDAKNVAHRLLLLERVFAYDVDGVILLDRAGKKIVRVDVDRKFRIPPLFWIIVGSVLGAAIEHHFHVTYFIARAIINCC